MKNIILDEDLKSLAKLTDNYSKAIIKAYEFTTIRKAKEINAEDLFLALINNKTSLGAKLLERMGVDLDATSKGILATYSALLLTDNNQAQVPELGEEAKSIIAKSYLIANELSHVYVGTEHLLLSLIKLDKYNFVQDLAKNNLNYEIVKQSLLNFGIYQPGIFAKSIDKEMMGDGKEAINYFTKDMTRLAEEGKYLKVWGRDDEIERIIHILSRRTKNNALLVGEAGVGKTAVVEGLVQRIVSGDIPAGFKHKKIVQLDISSIVAGSKIRGDIEERLLNIVSEMSENPDIIIFIDEIHMIVGAGNAGGGGTMDIANIIKPYLTNGDLRIIGATTFDEYQKYIEEDDALARRFQTIMVNEINKEEGVKVLQMLKPQFEKFHNVKFTDEAIEQAVYLSDRYLPSKYLPDKAIDIIDEAAAANKIKNGKADVDYSVYNKKLQKIDKEKQQALSQNNLLKAAKLRSDEVLLQKELKIIKSKNKKSRKVSVDIDDIRNVVAKWSGVPINSLKTDDLKKIEDIDKVLKEKIIGQEDTIKKISSVLKRSRMDLSSEFKPLASFLFLGPTGVGKTHTAKEIAKNLFGSEEALIQVDMSEYMEQHSVSKLIGSPPGYVGFQEGGQLTEKIRRHPYSVVLFDEIEKAHPDLLNILLQILEEGTLSDAKGRKINFKNCIIIMTSNIGAWESFEEKVLGFELESASKSAVDKGYEKMKETILENLKDSLSPEFINRIDEILIFKKLELIDAEKIIELQMNELNGRLKNKNMVLEYGKDLLKYLGKSGYNAEYGARNLKRTIVEKIENSLAEFLLEKKMIGKLSKVTNIKISLHKDKIKFTL
jgi:ATP-dependent Clp protease ATP-binding subunit ClpC